MKRKALLMSLCLGIFGAVFTHNALLAEKTYNVGDTGPAGGIVFYDKGKVTDGWQYLEAAPAKTEFKKVQWGAHKFIKKAKGIDGGFPYEYDIYEYTLIEGTDTGIGSGKRNTELIVKRLQELKEKGRAAQLCAGLKFAGFNDWFLPSKDELDLMYKNLVQKGLGGFNISPIDESPFSKSDWGSVYWSSSEDYDFDYLNPEYNGQDYMVWTQWFGDGNEGHQYSGKKSLTFSVRAIRAF